MAEAVEPLPDEPILDDNYPVYSGYYYILDGVVGISRIQGDVAKLKRLTNSTEVRRCSAVKRKLPLVF
jgi:hypothetical protein